MKKLNNPLLNWNKLLTYFKPFTLSKFEIGLINGIYKHKNKKIKIKIKILEYILKSNKIIGFIILYPLHFSEEYLGSFKIPQNRHETA